MTAQSYDGTSGITNLHHGMCAIARTRWDVYNRWTDLVMEEFYHQVINNAMTFKKTPGCHVFKKA